MRKFLMALMLGLVFLLPAVRVSAQAAILCYHEVDRENDDFAVSHQQLERHIVKMKKEGWHFVSLDEYIRYTKGEAKLPQKSVMLTFDDGYRSFYTKVYPLLQKYQVPAMLAIVSSWTAGEEKPNDVRDLASWEELWEMEKSGLVTVVSHTHAMHKQQAINPQGTRNGVVGSRLYFQDRYETEAEYRQRLQNDLGEVQRLFKEKLGHPARAMVWPYGIYTGEAVALAREAGMEATFLLDGGLSGEGEEGRFFAHRMIMTRDMGDRELEKLLTVNHDSWNEKNLRLAQVDLDSIYDENPTKYEGNLQAVIANLEGNDIGVVALQAFADPDGDGNVEAVYFKNRELPVAADILGDVSNRLLQRGLTVVAWLPVLNYQGFIASDGSNAVQSAGEKGWYRRLSPFDEAGLARVQNLFRDLSANTQVQGVLLQDDLYLNEDEDVSPAAQAAYRRDFGRELSEEASAREEVARWKRQALDRAADKAIAAFKEMRPQAITMRDIYAGALLYEGAERWLGQSYEDYLSRYDYTVVMAYPYMDKADNPQEYLRALAQKVKAAGGVDKTILKVQSYDWQENKWLTGEEFQGQLKTLRQAGMKHLGYYPATFSHWGK